MDGYSRYGRSEPLPAMHDNTKWYVLRVVSGKERKVKEHLDKEVQALRLVALVIMQVLCPFEKVFIDCAEWQEGAARERFPVSWLHHD